MRSNLVIYENIPLHNVQDYPTICYGVANPGEEQSCYGNVLIRSIAAFGLVRKWQSCFWLYVHPASLVIFRSSNDHERWLASGGGDISTRRKSREILLYIDFDTLGVLEGSQSGTKSPCRESLRLNSKTTSPSKLLSKLQKYALGDVSTKCSGNNVMYSFKLERYSSVGVDTIANFASNDANDIRVLRRVIHSCIELTVRSKRKKKNQRTEHNHADEDTLVSTVVSSQLRLSNTFQKNGRSAMRLCDKARVQ